MPDGMLEGFEGAIIGIVAGLIISAVTSALPSPYKEL
jgi:hypothetical protein